MRTQETESQTIIYNKEEGSRISRLCPNGKPVEKYFTDIPLQTLYCLFNRGLKLAGNRPFLGSRTKDDREYNWLSYTEVKDLAEYVGSALVNLGHAPRRGEKVGIYGSNRWEWEVSQLACNAYSLVSVPLYDTLGREAISYIVAATEMRTVVCDKEEKVKTLMAVHQQVPHLQNIVTMDDISSEVTSQAKNLGLNVYNFENFIQLGKQSHFAPQPPLNEDDLGLILFTSGTTGQPKGVMLSNRNLVMDAGAVLNHYEPVDVPSNEDILISYLPQAHGFNQVLTLCMVAHGARIGYLSGSVLQLLDDVKILKPTLFPIVPRLMNRIYDKIWQGASKSHVRKVILKKAYEAKKKQMSNGGLIKNDIWDKLVFRKVHKLLGGKVKGMVTGSAPVSSEVLTFIRCAVGCNVLEGYGQTETTAAATCSLPGDYKPGHVGVPLTCCEIKLVDIPEMNYFAKNNQGEVCFRGPHCFKGYWKDEKNTSETIDAHGWVHSGDVGVWTEQGTLRLVDRKKNIFKLAQGEYIAPEKIEGIYLQCPTVAQVYVHGDSLETCCVAIVVPDEEVVRELAEHKGIEEKSWEGICANKEIQQFVLKEMLAKGNEHKLNKLEQVKNVFLWSQQFTIENDLLTPTLKSKRPQLRVKFAEEIRKMYDEVMQSSK